jgi:phenylalanyl-tRNA synthetase beta chain
MKLSLNWIREYVDLPADLTMEQLSYDLTMRTVEVEGIENPADSLKDVVIGKIIEIHAHPNADQLSVCQVDIGTEKPSSIVCGGSNIKAGQLVVVAVPGAYVKWHGIGDPVEIKAVKLRGVQSEGMICAASELGLEDLFPTAEEKEIMDVSSWEAKPGAPAAQILQLDDYILEIDNKSMTNRPDLWGHYGIARELAAIYGKELKPLPAFQAPAGTEEFPVDIQDQQHCHRYAAIVYTGLKNEPSPYWLKVKIWKIGMRPINNLVDMTNYVMLATGQPAHGFDKDHVAGGIMVRKARPGEKLVLLDNKVLQLSDQDTLICNRHEPIGLAGIMGGKQSSILPETQELVLEMANFDPLSLRRTAQRFGIRTEASTRYEKGIDTQRIDQAMAVADWIMKQVLPEARIVAVTDNHPQKTESPVITVPMAFLAERLGRELTVADVVDNLNPLGFSATFGGGIFEVTVPSWRGTGDVSLQDDILEEVARIIGYENFAFIPPAVTLERAINQRKADTDRAIREYLAYRCGLQEVFTYPWVDDQYLEAAGISGEECLTLATPPSPEEAHLRTSLIPGLLSSIATNSRHYDTFKCFELAQVFHHGETHPSDPEETLPLQESNLAAGFVGEDAMELFRRAKGVLEMLPRIAQIAPLSMVQLQKPQWADPKAWLNILAGEEVIGSLGVLSPRGLRLAGIKRSRVALFEINVEKLQPLPSRQNQFKHLPQFPLVEQDFSVVIDEGIKWAEIKEIVAPLVHACEFVEEYRGAQVPAGKKSILFRVWYGSASKTLTADEIDERTRNLIRIIGQKIGGELRI